MNRILKTQKCRTCLKSSTKTICITKSLTGCSQHITYAQLLREYAKFEYNTDYERNLPQFLCFLCSSQLKNTYVFIQQAQQCNKKLINILTKQLCLQEQVIDLPQQQDEVPVFIKKDYSDNRANLDDYTVSNFITNEANSSNENNLVKNNSYISEPILTTEQIIEYDLEDNVILNESFIAESALTAEQIIEYDSENQMNMDNDNSSTDTKKDDIVFNSKEASISKDIETLESENSLLETKQKLLSKEQTFECTGNQNSSQATNCKSPVEIPKTAKKLYKCYFCEHVAKTSAGRKYHHLSKHGTDDDKLKCNFCSYKNLNKGYILNHIKKVHKELIKSLKANAVNNTDESNNSNDLIKTPTNEEESISGDNDIEQDAEDSDEDFIRSILNMKKKDRRKLSTKALVTRCEVCDKIFKHYKSLRDHQLHVHKSEDMFSVCPHCKKKCKRESDLKIHIRQIHGPPENKQKPKPRSKEKRFMCAECSYTCRTSTLLKIHVNRHHTGERPYKCDICSKSFVVPRDLRIHRYMHTGEKPYKCSVCSKNFRDSSHMRRHVRLHTNKHPFTCDDCGKGFTQSYNLSVHKRTHLKGNKLGCSVCGKFFKNNSMLNIHQINENHYDEVDEAEKGL